MGYYLGRQLANPVCKYYYQAPMRPEPPGADMECPPTREKGRVGVARPPPAVPQRLHATFLPPETTRSEHNWQNIGDLSK